MRQVLSSQGWDGDSAASYVGVIGFGYGGGVYGYKKWTVKMGCILLFDL